MLTLLLIFATSFFVLCVVRHAHGLQRVEQWRIHTLALLSRCRKASTSENTPASRPLTSTSERKYPRLSRSPSALKPSYDVVIVGSGYGSGVAASRFARTGKSVCVLERGVEKWPGEYPHTAQDAMRSYEVCGQAFGESYRIGKAASLYRAVKGEGQDVIMGCGLGGTSLINAGVWLRADERILTGREWPVEIRGNGLDKYYQRGERMLRPTPYPSTYAAPKKLTTLEVQALKLGVQDAFYRPPLTSSFKNHINHAGVRMRANTGSGNECSGINDGSKTSVLVTYLADAWAWGAEIFCGVDVKHLKKRDNDTGYVVFVETNDADGLTSSSWIIANELVILGAGAISTSTILLRSRPYGLSGSPLLGQRLSGNGDTLTFAYNCKQTQDAIGRESGSGCGPTITGCIDLRGAAHTTKTGRDGFVIQDGAMPEVLSPVIQTLLETYRVGPASRSYDWLRGTIARLKSWILGPYTANGSVKRTMVFLTMSHDENQGIIELLDDEVSVKWAGPSTSGDRTSRIEDMIKQMTEDLGGMYAKSPEMTVHPLGGAVISSDGAGLGGVVSHRGELFTGYGDAVHTGIFCVDGSIVPTSLGVNPCATITALSERTCDLILRERGWEADESPNGELDLHGDPPYAHRQETACKAIPQPQQNGSQFDETMRGHIHIGSDITDFETAESAAKAASSTAAFTLRVTVNRKEPSSYCGLAHGTFACGALSPDPMLVTSGSVKFFTIDESVSDAMRMTYKLELLTTAEKKYILHGYKRIDPGVTLSVPRTWRAMTTLFTTITAPDGSIVGRGILHLSIKELMVTLRVLYGRSNTRTALCFLSFFARHVAAYFFSPFRPLQHPSPSTDTTGYFAKPTPESITIRADDGITIPLKIWRPPPGTHINPTPLLFLPGAAVSDTIFSLPTIPVNAIDYFTGLGYTCYAPTLRFGAGENARWGHTAFDARLDVRAAVQYVHERERSKVYIVAHCLGSIALGMALLTGAVNTDWIAGVTASQVFMHIEYSTDNAFKARHPGLLWLYETLSSSPWFPLSSTPRIPLINTLLRFYPPGDPSELCASATCHRCFVPFGRCWTHANLNRATHAYLDRFFDGVHTSFMRHLSLMGSCPPHTLRANLLGLEDLVTPANLQRLRGVKVLFLYGEENAVWDGKATRRSFDVLRDAFGEEGVEWVGVRGYGHLDCWMGRDAVGDVWGWVGRHVGLCGGEGEEWVDVGEGGVEVEGSRY